MSAKKSGLGRGFDSLIPTDLIDEEFDPTAEVDEAVSTLGELDLAKVFANPDQPRRTFDEEALDELAASIKEHGVIQPIVVTPVDGKFEIVAGERRYRASKKAGLSKIPAIVRTLSDQNKLELSIIENLQRRDLNSLETATAYLKLRDQFNLSLEEIGNRVGGKSVSAISNTLRLLRLPDAVKKSLLDGKLTEGQARPLVGIDEADILKVLPLIIKDEWSARRVEQYIVDLKGGVVAKPAVKPAAVEDVHTDAWRKRLGTKNIRISTNSRGAGQIVIKFKSREELDKIQNLLG